MKRTSDYKTKFGSFKNKTLFEKLSADQRQFIEELAYNYKFTFQEFRQIAEASRDLTMWGEEDIISWWKRYNYDSQTGILQNKKTALKHLKSFLNQLLSPQKKMIRKSMECVRWPLIKPYVVIFTLLML